MTFARIAKRLGATCGVIGSLIVAGCAQPTQSGSGLMWYRKPAKPPARANTIDVGRVQNPSSIDLVDSPRGATDSADAGAEIRTGGGGLRIGSTQSRAVLNDSPPGGALLGPNVGGGLQTGITGTTLQPAEASGSTLSVEAAR